MGICGDVRVTWRRLGGLCRKRFGGRAGGEVNKVFEEEEGRDGRGRGEGTLTSRPSWKLTPRMKTCKFGE